MKILNCSIFTHGVTVSAVGDLIVNNTVFHKDASVLNETPLGSIFFARDELAGLSDGSLFITNCKVINNIENTKLISCIGSYSDITKSESPLTHIFWRNIIVENLVCEGSYPLNLAPTVHNNNAPFNISYNGIYGDVLWENTAADEGTSLVSSNADMHITKHTITLRDIPSLKIFSLLCSFATNYEVRRSVVLENVHNINDPSGAVPVVIRGYIDIYIDKSDVSSIISCNSGNNAGLERVCVNRCRINTQNKQYPFVFPNTGADINFSKCIFFVQPTLGMFTGIIADPSNPSNNITGVFGHIKFSGNTVINKDAKLKNKNAIIIQDWLSDLGDEKTFSLPVGFFNIPGVNTYFIHLGYSDEYNVACCKPFPACFETHYFKPSNGGSDLYVTFLPPYSVALNQGTIKANTSVRMLSIRL
jgi:hypothetical protein